MKKYLIILIIFLLTYTAISQDKRFTVFAYTDPNATLKDGFNIGTGIDYQMTIVYFKAQAFVFPDLRGKKYLEFTGTPIGFNQHLFNDSFRLYEGFKVGVIKRDKTHPMIGFESGLEYYFNSYRKGLFIGFGGSYDYRIDGKEEEIDIKPYWRLSGLFKIGFTI